MIRRVAHRKGGIRLQAILWRSLRMLVNPATWIIVVLLAPLAAWVWPKTIMDSDIQTLAHYRGFFALRGTFLGPRFFRLQREGCVIDYSEPGYNPFECRYPDGTMHAQGTCNVEYDPERSLNKTPFPEIENVYDGDFYKPDGSLGSSVRNGTGVQTFWSPDGHKQWELELSDAKRVHLRKWHQNGQLMLDQSYRNDLPDGPYVSFHANGMKRSEGHYSEGRETGRWTGLDENGVLVTDTEFDNGDVVLEKNYEFENGTLIRIRYIRGLSIERNEYYTAGKVSRIEYFDDQGEIARVENVDSSSKSEAKPTRLPNHTAEPVTK